MELLLLDTTEREGEDNQLYHFCAPTAACTGTSDAKRRVASTWRGLRGVLAAAVGTTASVCGEPLQRAHFGSSSISTSNKLDGVHDDASDVVGFVDLNEVLYVLAFPATANVPVAFVQYYTRSSCDLLLSLFGYPGAKLREWTRSSSSSSNTTEALLTAQLDAFFTAVLATIQRDLSGDTHVQFAFRGRVPVVHYPLDVLAELAVLEPLQLRDELLVTTTIAGRCIRYRKCVVLSTVRPDVLQLVNQWLLAPRKPFDALTSFASTTMSDGYRVVTFELHDHRFARHGVYPKRHVLLLLEHGDLEVVYLVERSLAGDCDLDAPISRAVVDCLDEPTLAQLERVASTKLPLSLERMRIVRTLVQSSRPSATTLTTLSTAQPTHSFASYWVVLDLVRDTIIGEGFYDSVVSGLDARSDDRLLAALFRLFVERIAVLEQTFAATAAATNITVRNCGSSHHNFDSNVDDTRTYVAPLALDVSDTDTLFLHDVSAAADVGADISHDDVRVFPPHGETLNGTAKTVNGSRTHALLHERLVHHEAESHIVESRAIDSVCSSRTDRSQRLWVVANYYETVRLYAIFDADVVDLKAIEHAADRACSFGGNDTVE